MNRVTLIGRLGRDPEIKHTQSGAIFANFSIATSERWRDKSTGERKEHTDWHNCVCWNEGLCKVLEQYVRKGSQIAIEGKLQTRKWQDKNGNDRYSTEVILQGFGCSIELLGGKNEGGGSRDDDSDDRGSRGSSKQSSGSGGGGGYRRSADMDDEIPFAPEWRG